MQFLTCRKHCICLAYAWQAILTSGNSPTQAWQGSRSIMYDIVVKVQELRRSSSAWILLGLIKPKLSACEPRNCIHHDLASPESITDSCLGIIFKQPSRRTKLLFWVEILKLLVCGMQPRYFLNLNIYPTHDIKLVAMTNCAHKVTSMMLGSRFQEVSSVATILFRDVLENSIQLKRKKNA